MKVLYAPCLEIGGKSFRIVPNTLIFKECGCRLNLLFCKETIDFIENKKGLSVDVVIQDRELNGILDVEFEGFVDNEGIFQASEIVVKIQVSG